jgi:hypothetical protein
VKCAGSRNSVPFAALGDDSASERPDKDRKKENKQQNYIYNITRERRSF